MKILVIFILLFKLSETSFAQSKSELQNYFPDSKVIDFYQLPEEAFSLGNFSIVEPGLTLLPFYKGIFALGLNGWAWKDDKFSNIISVYVNDEKEIYYVIDLVENTSNLYRVALNDEEKVINKITSFDGIIVDIKSKDKENIFYYGISNENIFQVWKLGQSVPELMLSTTSVIMDIDIINKDDYIISFKEEGLLYFSNNRYIKHLMKPDVLFNSIVTASDGSMFVSTEYGIFRFYSDDPKDFDVVCYHLNGRIKLYRGYLYILSNHFNSIIKIKI